MHWSLCYSTMYIHVHVTLQCVTQLLLKWLCDQQIIFTLMSRINISNLIILRVRETLGTRLQYLQNKRKRETVLQSNMSSISEVTINMQIACNQNTQIVKLKSQCRIHHSFTSEQVDYSTFDWLKSKMLECIVPVQLPCDWLTLSGWPRLQ